MDLNEVEQMLTVVENAIHQARRDERVLHELDRLAEVLVGETAQDAPAIKLRTQELIIMAGREPTHAMETYIEAYCR